MFSRRVFEILASSTALVSTDSIGMEKMLGSVIDVFNDLDSAKSKIKFLLEMNLTENRYLIEDIEL